MAEQIILIPIRGPRSAEELDHQLAQTGPHRWTVDADGSAMDQEASTLIVFFSAELEDDDGRSLKFESPWVRWRLWAALGWT